MARVKASFAEKQHADIWRDAHDRETFLMRCFMDLGHTRDEAARLTDEHIHGWARARDVPGHNGGPAMDDQA